MENHKQVEDFAKKIKTAEPRLSIRIDGSYIYGTFRGKQGNEYKYCFTSKELVYDNGGYAECVINEILKNEELKEIVEKLGGQVNEDATIAEFSFDDDVSSDGGENITLESAIEIEKQMMSLGFDGGLLGSELDESDWSVLRFEIK